MRSKGVNKNIIPQCTTLHETLSSCKNLKYISATVIEFRFFNQIPKKKKKEKNMAFTNIAHIVHLRPNFSMVIFTMVVVYVD